MIFKLHPNESVGRAREEIRLGAPEALVFAMGSAEELIDHCHTFVTRYSSTVLIALALGTNVVCDLDVEVLKQLLPLQHGQAARNVAAVCRELRLIGFTAWEM